MNVEQQKDAYDSQRDDRKEQAAEAKTAEERLRQINDSIASKDEHLAKDQADLDSEAADSKTLKAVAASLTTAVNDIQQGTADLEKKLADRAAAIKDLNDYYQSKWADIQKLFTPEQMKAIDDLIKSYDGTIHDEQGLVTEYHKKLHDASHRYTPLDTAKQDAQDVYTQKKSYLATVDSLLKAADMKKEIDEQTDNKKKYALLKVMKSILEIKDLQLPSAADFKKSFNDAAIRLSNANQTVAETKSSIDVNKKALNDATKRLAGLKDGRKKAWLDQIDRANENATNNGNAKPAAAA